jgi:hypothetical protein
LCTSLRLALAVRGASWVIKLLLVDHARSA